MQVKFTRNTAKKGLLGGKTVYQLSAMVMPTEQEDQLLTRHGRWVGGNVQVLMENATREGYPASFGMSMMDLRNGKTIEHENFNVILFAEGQIMSGCQNIIDTCEALDTFGGSERVIEIGDEKPKLVAVG